MDTREVLKMLRAAWWLPVLGMLVGGLAALAASLATTPLYAAQSQLFVSTRSDTSSTFDVFQGSQFSQQRAASYAQLLSGEELSQRVIDRLNLDLSAEELSRRVSATAVPDTVLLNVTVIDPDPQQARDVAAAIGAEFPTLVAELETPDDGESSPVKVTVTERPSLPVDPTSPNTVRNVSLGLLLGAVLGAAVAVTRSRWDRSLKIPEEAADLVGAPLIGTILRDQALERGHTIDRVDAGRTAEDYRQLRTNLQFLNVDAPPRVIMVSSALPSEGKTTLVVNLALTLVDAGQRVTVVEADLRRPKVVRYLGLVGGVGLTNVLAGTAEVEDVLQTYREDLMVVGAGPMPPNPGEMLASSHMVKLIEQLRAQSDYVLIDAPPVLPVADATGLAAAMDGVLLSVRYGGTRKDQLQQAATALHRVGGRILGVVLNIVPPKADVASAYGYGYSYGSEPGREREADMAGKSGRSVRRRTVE